MWDLPRPGLELVSPALAGRFSTTAPPGKPLVSLDIGREEVGLASESSGSRTGSVMTVFPFLCLKSWLLWYNHSFSVTSDDSLNGADHRQLQSYRTVPGEGLTRPKEGELFLSPSGWGISGTERLRKGHLWAGAHSWTNC